MKNILTRTAYKIVVFLILTLLAIFLFVVGHRFATMERGYQAIGGELLLAILPYVIYYCAIPTVCDMARDIRDLLRSQPDTHTRQKRERHRNSVRSVRYGYHYPKAA